MFVRYGLVSGLVARITWPLALPLVHVFHKPSPILHIVKHVFRTKHGVSWFLVSTAQTMRAVLLAMATAATFPGFRAMISAKDGSYRSGFLAVCRMLDIMPMTSNRRMY
jgi:hypothetical protein